MKYTVEIDINLPRDKVIELIDNTENLYKWLEGLQSFESLMMKGAFAKQSLKHMPDFKAFAEDGVDVRDKA